MAQNGYAVAYGVCIAGVTPTIRDAATNIFWIAKLVQSADMREEPVDIKEFKDCAGVVRTRIINGTKRTLTITLIPTNGSAGATGGITIAEDDVKLPSVGEALVLQGFMGAGITSGEINGTWYYMGRGRVILSNTDAVRLECELEQIYDSGGTAVTLTATS